RYPGYAGLWAAGGDISEFETYKNLTSRDLSGRSEKNSEEQVGPIGEIQPDDFVPIDNSDPDADFEDAVVEPDEETKEPDEDAVEVPVEVPVEETVEETVEEARKTKKHDEDEDEEDEDDETDEETEAKIQDKEKDEEKKTKKQDEDDDDDKANALSDSESIAKNRPRRNRLPPQKYWVGERPIYKYEDGYGQLVGKSEVFCAASVKKAEKELEKMRNKIGRVKRNTNKYKVQKQMAIFVNDLKLSDFKNWLVEKGYKAEFLSGTLLINGGKCSIRRGEMGFSMEGALSKDDYKLLNSINSIVISLVIFPRNS
ncbi:hypothetical protein CRE_12341, partial [Caenorhabditis remanei]